MKKYKTNVFFFFFFESLILIIFICLAVTEQIFKIASMEPGAMLYEASKEFEVRMLQ